MSCSRARPRSHKRADALAPAPAMIRIRLTVVTPGGDEVAVLDADPSWQARDVIAALPEQLDRQRVLLGSTELSSTSSLADVGVGSSALVTLLISKRPPPILTITHNADSTAQLWRSLSGERVSTFHVDNMWGPLGDCADFSPDGQQLVIGSFDSAARLFCASSGRCLRTFRDHGDSIKCVQFSPDGSKILTCGSDAGMPKLWSVTSGECLYTLEGDACDASLSPNGQHVLTGSRDGTARVMSIDSGRCVRIFVGHRAAITCCVLSHDGSVALTGSEDGTAKLWSIDSGECLSTLTCGGSGVLSANFSQDGRRLLTRGFDERNTEGRPMPDTPVTIWCAASGKSLLTLSSRTAMHAELSPDGQGVLTATFHAKDAKLWDATSGECLRTLEGHGDTIMSIKFSPDGGYALTGSRDGTAKLWDPASGECLRTYDCNAGSVDSVRFAPESI